MPIKEMITDVGQFGPEKRGYFKNAHNANLNAHTFVTLSGCGSGNIIVKPAGNLDRNVIGVSCHQIASAGAAAAGQPHPDTLTYGWVSLEGIVKVQCVGPLQNGQAVATSANGIGTSGAAAGAGNVGICVSADNPISAAATGYAFIDLMPSPGAFATE